MRLSVVIPSLWVELEIGHNMNVDAVGVFEGSSFGLWSDDQGGGILHAGSFAGYRE